MRRGESPLRISYVNRHDGPMVLRTYIAKEPDSRAWTANAGPSQAHGSPISLSLRLTAYMASARQH